MTDPSPSKEPRQRWRIVIARGEAARELLHRDVTTAWETGLLASGLPLAMTEGATRRPRVTFAAPAPLGMIAERELLDIVLSRILRIDQVRGAVERSAPGGYRLVDLYDVWLGRPSLAASVVAGDYRVSIDPEGAADRDPLRLGEVEAAVAALLAATRVERTRVKGQGAVTVDIRPHLSTLRVGMAAGGDDLELRMRLRLGGEGGVGRPEEVVAALGERLGGRLVARRIVRERIVLADDEDR